MNWLIAAFMLAAASTYQATSPAAPTVRDLSPSPGATVKAFFPRLSARIDTRGEPLLRKSLRVYVDGQDVTPSATISGDTIAYVPHEHMQAGWHDAFVEGNDAARHAFSEGWVFKTENPDIDLPVGDDDGFAFLPVGLQTGPFAHFFLVSPFDGFGFVQFCGFGFPMTRVVGTPVFFVTVPATFGTALLGCNPGVLFTPFQSGIGELNPIFFPIEIAGPGFFQNPNRRRRPLISGPTMMPVYRTVPTTPVYRTAPVMPVNRTAPSMPVYRTQPMPVTPVRAPVMGVPRAPAPRMPAPRVVPRCCTHTR